LPAFLAELAWPDLEPRFTGAAIASEQVSVIARIAKRVRKGRKRDLIKLITILVRNARP
jgi:hypothetical protein